MHPPNSDVCPVLRAGYRDLQSRPGVNAGHAPLQQNSNQPTAFGAIVEWVWSQPLRIKTRKASMLLVLSRLWRLFVIPRRSIGHIFLPSAPTLAPRRNYPEHPMRRHFLTPVGTFFKSIPQRVQSRRGWTLNWFVLLNQGIPMRARFQNTLNVQQVFGLCIFSRNLGGKARI